MFHIEGRVLLPEGLLVGANYDEQLLEIDRLEAVERRLELYLFIVAVAFVWTKLS
jgi:hypothetical protein